MLRLPPGMTMPPRTNIKGACTIVFALAEVWVMRLEKLPFEVVLLVGRVNFHGLYMVRVPGGGVRL